MSDTTLVMPSRARLVELAGRAELALVTHLVTHGDDVPEPCDDCLNLTEQELARFAALEACGE